MISLTAICVIWSMMGLFVVYKWGPVITRCFGNSFIEKLMFNFDNNVLDCVDHVNINDMNIIERIIGTLLMICAPTLILIICRYVPTNNTYRYTIMIFTCAFAILFGTGLLFAVPLGFF